jgi:hypothetical protein
MFSLSLTNWFVLLSLHKFFHTQTQSEMPLSAFHLHIVLYSRILFVKHKQIHLKLSSVISQFSMYLYAKQLQKWNKTVVMNISTFSFCFTVRRPFYQVKGVQFKWVKRLDDQGGKSNFHLCRGFKRLKNRFFKISKKLVEITFSYEASVDSVAFRQFTKKKVSSTLVQNKNCLQFSCSASTDVTSECNFYYFFIYIRKICAGKFVNHRSSVNPKLGVVV